MKTIQIAANCKTRIIQRQFSSLATTYTFGAAPRIQGGYLAGIVEIKGSNWIFPKPVQRMPLQPSNTVSAGVWDTFFSVDVISEVDAEITLQSKSLGGLLWLIGLILVVVAVAIALFSMS